MSRIDGGVEPYRLVCGCGYAKDWSEQRLFAVDGRGAVYHGDMRLPLWLSVSCAGDTLWALNREHLTLVKRFVSATLRERVRDTEFGWQNKSLLNRLPKWIQSAKHRDEVLRGIRKLETKLESTLRG